MNRILRSLLILVLLAAMNPVKSQDFSTFIHDNYAGSTGMFYNPASIADSRYKFDMEIFGLSNRIDNNWVQIDNDAIFKWFRWKEVDFKNNYLTLATESGNKYAILNIEARPLNFMFSYNSKNSFGFGTRVRGVVNLDDIPEDAATLAFNNNNVASLMKHHVFENMGQMAVSWAEYGFTWGRVLLDEQSEHFVKAGVTAKLLQGIGAIYLYEKYLEYNLIDPDTATMVTADIYFGITGNMNDMLSYKFESKPALGLDLGVVYEWRPNFKKFQYDMDGKQDLWRKDQNKYKLRVGLSLLDLGSMKFQKQYNSGNFLIDTPLVNLALLHAESMVDLADSINRLFGTQDKNSYFSMRLPTTLNLNIDYHVIKGLYVNLAGRLAFNQGNAHIEKVHYLNNITLTPRYESRWWGVNVPVSYNQAGLMNFGIGLRMGPIWVGSSDLLALTGLKDNITGTDIHLAIKIPIMYKAPKDRDDDKVSDKYDECVNDKGDWALKGCPDSDKDGVVNKDDDCPYTAGVAEFKGCPDTDQDGVQDKYDLCPDVYGEKRYSGCPDSDGDGIIDIKDSCSTIAGVEFFNGCPDSDGDSIVDHKDDCPEVAGSEAFNGCPDTDKDGVRDADDLCPTVAGLDSLSGCPYIDTDNDGIQDKYDRCPKIAGPIENQGCPETDTDNDGVLDKDDYCPMTPGPVENNGCPVIAKEEQEILDTAFANLEFETAKSVIKTSSHNSLDKIVELMNKKPDFKLLIEGHTDNVGRDASNMSLSQNRALAVKQYLVSKGIDADRINAKWYGETKPIADNDTEEGRQKNRRVEMKIVFD